MPNSKNITFDQLQSALTRVKNSLDKKANTSHGNHVPKTETANNARFLRNDNTWQTITPVNIGAADRSHNHTSLTGVTSLQFAAGSSDSAVMKVTTESANTYLDFEMNDDAGSDMYRWRFSAYDTAGATPYFNLMTLTAKDTTSARLTVNGDVTASSFTGNASSATKLQTARALKIGNTSKNFDGTGNVTWTLSEIGAAASSHSHSYLPLSGGTITGEVTLNNYLSLNAWSGYGSGKAQIWYNGTAKELVVQPTAVTNIRVNNNTVLHTGNYKTHVTPANIGAAASSHSHNYVPLSNCGSTTILADSDASTTTEYAQLQAGHNYLRVTSSAGGGTATQGADKLTFNGNIVYHAGRKPTVAEIGAAASSHTHSSIGGFAVGAHNLVGNNVGMSSSTGNGFAFWAGANGAENSNSAPFKVSHEGKLYATNATITGTLTGNASSATKLQTARALKIGNTSKNFDGTGNVTWTLSEIGAAASSHSHSYLPLSGGTVSNSGFNSLHIERSGNTNGASIGFKNSNGTLGYIGMKDSANGGLMRWSADTNTVYTVLDSGNFNTYAAAKSHGTHVTYATATPLADGTAAVGTSSKVAREDHVHPLQTTVSGNAGTATKLANARTLTIGNTGKAFDGSGNVSWSLSEIGAAAANHSHGYVPTGTGSSITIHADNDASSASEYLLLKAGHNELKITSSAGGGTVTKGADKLTFNGNVVYHAGYKPSASAIGALPLSGGTMTGSITSSLVSSTWLDGSKGKALLSSNASAGSYVALLRGVSTNGYFTLSSYQNKVYLNYQSKDSVDAGTNSVTKQATLLDESGNASFPGTVTASSFSGSLSGNASSATKLANARNIKIGNTSRSFNGTGDVTWTLSDIGAAAASHGTHVPATQTADNTKFLRNDNTWQAVTPANIGAANASHGTHVTYGGNGSATTVSRSDHTHSYIPLGGSSSISGNLEFSNSGNTTRGVIGTMGDNDYWRIVGGATASNSGYLEIATADDASEPIYVRQYGSGKFGTLTRTATLLDASGNTSFPCTVTAPTFSGTLNGNASTASKLQTARKINDVSFDGSADVVIPIKSWKSTVGDSNSKPYHRILTSGVVAGQWTDKVITVMASANYDGGPFGIFRVVLRTNGTNSDSTIKIEWITRKGFDTGSIVANFIKTNGATQADIFYKSAGTYASVTWTILGEGDRSSGSYNTSWTKINTAAATTEVYTEAEMKALKSYTSTLLKGTDVAHVSESNTSAQLTTARTINGTSFNGTANITTTNWGTARNISIASSDGTNAGSAVSVNGSGNVTLKLSDTIKASLSGNASTATTLQTARTINGTSFNGSANITTTNWGTARTITIGSKGKSVNGSGNVSWSLSEIGALPAAGGTVSGNLAVSGAFSVGGKKITINSSAPSSPAVGDIWIKI